MHDTCKFWVYCILYVNAEKKKKNRPIYVWIFMMHAYMLCKYCMLMQNEKAHIYMNKKKSNIYANILDAWSNTSNHCHDYAIV